MVEATASNMTSLEFAHLKHADQKRLNGSPFIAHPVVVATIVSQIVPTAPNLETLIDAAYLHDTVEDTDTSLDEIEKHFGPTVAGLVNELTSDKNQIKTIGKGPYLLKKMTGMSNDALLLKLSDRLGNIRDTASLVLTDERYKRFAEKYKKETLFILDNLKRELLAEHLVLITEIRKVLDTISV